MQDQVAGQLGPQAVELLELIRAAADTAGS
jgi:hypothetical protein